MGRPKDGLDAPYRRYRHKSDNYVVEVLGVETVSGAAATWKAIHVRGTLLNTERETTWNLGTFLILFKPVGKKLRQPTSWDRLDDPVV